MLYKFKSKVTGDLVMLDAHGRRLLGIIGKDAEPKGIVLPGQMPAAIQAIEEAVQREEAERAAVAEAPAQGQDVRDDESVGLRQRAMPFIDMLRRAHAADTDITWGV